MKTLVLCVLLTLASTAVAQDREEEMLRDEERMFGDDATTLKDTTEERLNKADKTLQIGGQLYLRFDTKLTDGTSVDDHTISMPNLVDAYLDARPNDRLRAFVRGRMRWNPSIPEEGATSVFGQKSERLDFDLDELWLRFDLKRTVYVTIGQAKIRWGTTRIWNPVDVINTSRRVPLQPFDERNGIPQVKLHMPIERLGWNLYALALTDSVKHFDEFGVAGRAEIVFSTVEMGLTGAWRENTDPKAGVDVSAGIGVVDITGELGLTFAEETPTIQASAGIQYANKYGDQDVVYLGLEYFYNEEGHDSLDEIVAEEWSQFDLNEAESYEFDGLAGLQPFYIGKHYGAAFVSFPGLGAANDTAVTVSAIGNFSDKSALARLDVSTTFLTHLTVQAYVTAHLFEAGELRFGHDALSNVSQAQLLLMMYPNPVDPSATTRELPMETVDAGIYLKMKF